MQLENTSAAVVGSGEGCGQDRGLLEFELLALEEDNIACVMLAAVRFLRGRFGLFRRRFILACVLGLGLWLEVVVFGVGAVNEIGVWGATLLGLFT